MGVISKTEATKEYLRHARKAILGRGGEISATAGIRDLPNAIFNIPADTSLAYSTDDTTAYKKTVPSGAEEYARLESVGGMTRVATPNIFKTAKKGGVVLSGGDSFDYMETISEGLYVLDFGDLDMSIIDDLQVYIEKTEGEYDRLMYDYQPPYIYLQPYDSYNYLSIHMKLIEFSSQITATINSSDVTNAEITADGEVHSYYMGAYDGNGSPSQFQVNIRTDRRVKVTLTGIDTLIGIPNDVDVTDGSFILEAGTYELYNENTSDSDAQVGIKLEDLSEYRIFPMLYVVPDDSPEHILTEYQPYEAHLVPTAVTEIVSKGANLAVCTENKTYTLAGLTVIRESGKSSAVVNGTATSENSFKLFGTFKLNAGTYTASVYGLNATDRLYLGSGSAVIVNGVKQNASITFTITEDKECFFQMVFANGSAYSNTKIEVMLNVGYPAAPYRPYTTEPIDTVAIPDAVKNDAGWGHGLRSATANLTTQRDFHNTYNFNTKEYTKWLSDKIVVDGENVKATQLLTKAGGIKVLLNATNSSYADYTAFKSTVFTPSLSNTVGTAYLTASDTILSTNVYTSETFATVDEANAWLKANPFELVYALEEPIVTTIEDDSATPKFIKVEGGGEIVFENEAEAAVPSTVNYIKKVGT